MANGVSVRTAHFALHRHALSQDTPQKGARGQFNLFPLCAVWLGAMVPKRLARRAVTRNAIKRQIYLTSTSYETLLTPMAYVVRLRAGFDRTSYPSASSSALKAVVRQELLQLFNAATRTGN